eukprot:jgi/Mesvir1/27258/Mv07095-RA.2
MQREAIFDFRPTPRRGVLPGNQRHRHHHAIHFIRYTTHTIYKHNTQSTSSDKQLTLSTNITRNPLHHDACPRDDKCRPHTIVRPARCPCKRTNVVPDSPSNSKGGDPGVDQGQQHEGGPTQGGRPSSPPAGPLPPASSSAPSRGQGHDTTRSSEKGSAGLLVDTCYGCPVPPCLWERVATYTDAAEERFEMLREPSPCLSMDKPAAAQGCLLSIPGPHMDITAWASGRGSAAGRPSPSLLRWTSCAAVLGDECGCDARNAAHVRGMLLEIPLGFAGMVREWNQSAERSASWRPLRCPWCPAPAVCGDNLLFIPSKEYLGLIDGAALVCSQGHLLVWSVHT